MRLTERSGAWLLVALTLGVYLPAVANGWAGDDLVVVPSNDTVKSIALAWYRPFTILTYAVDWAVSGGGAWWFHLVNIGLHVAATAMVYYVARAWLGPGAALLAALLFGIHPVHVEAVANVVGRAELLTAVGTLGAILTARRVRTAVTSRGAGFWGVVAVTCVGAALFSKEHAVVAVCVLVLDHWAGAAPAASSVGRARMVSLYAAVGGVTAGWLVLWRGVSARFVGSGAHEALADLSVVERLTTMLPVALEVVRLLTWPLRLMSDYAPWVTEIRTQWTAAAVMGAVMVAASLGLGVAARRRFPALAAGVLLGVVTLAPTSNVVFVSGVVLAERTMYLAVLAPALALGTLWMMVPIGARRVGGVAAAGYCLLLGAVTVDRIPVWRDNVTLLAEARTSMPTNYRVRQRIAAFYEEAGDSARALDERVAAYELFPVHPRGGLFVAELAYAMGAYPEALTYLEANRVAHPDDPLVRELEVHTLVALGRPDSAVRAARAALDVAPGSGALIRVHRAALDSAESAPWMRIMARAREAAAAGDFVAATERIAEVRTELRRTDAAAIPGGCWELDRALPLLTSLEPDAVPEAHERLLRWRCPSADERYGGLPVQNERLRE